MAGWVVGVSGWYRCTAVILYCRIVDGWMDSWDVDGWMGQVRG